MSDNNDKKYTYVVSETEFYDSHGTTVPICVCDTEEKAEECVMHAVKGHLKREQARSRWFETADDQAIAEDDDSFKYDYIKDDMILCPMGADAAIDIDTQWEIRRVPLYFR